MTKSNYDLTHQMRDDVMAAYRDVAPHCWSQEEAWVKVAKHPAKRYYISPKQAHDILRKMTVGNFEYVNKMRPERQRLYYSLFEKLQAMTQKKEFIGKSLAFICPFLVTQPAPEFFVSASTISQIFANYKKYGREYRYIPSQHRIESSPNIGDTDVSTDV